MRFVLPTTYARTRIYRPRREAVTLVSLQHADVTEISVTADDGIRLNGWYALSRAERNGPRPFILYFPGASGHRGYRVNEIEMFSRLGCDVLLFDYRGYGDNAGQPTERHQASDARTVWTFVRDVLHIPAERIVVFGESIGGGVGVRLVAESCRREIVPAGLILQATFTSMLDVVSQFFPRFLASIFLVDRYPSIRQIRHVTSPLMSIHGTNDRLIPIDLGRRLFAAAPDTSAIGCRKQFLELPGVDHNDVLEEAGDLVEATIERFLRDVLPPDSAELRHDESTSRRSGVMQSLR